jgi:hypothetical protein
MTLLAAPWLATIRFTNDDVMTNMGGMPILITQTLKNLRWVVSSHMPHPNPSPEGEGLMQP